MLKYLGHPFKENALWHVLNHDELVINGPSVNVPCISISRWPYDEYHTSDGNLGIVFVNMRVEATDVTEEITRIFCTNYIPRHTFRGPVFLSGHGLWVDPRVDPKLNQSLDEIMLRLQDEHGVFDIAHGLKLDYWRVKDYVESFRITGLVQATFMRSGEKYDEVHA